MKCLNKNIVHDEFSLMNVDHYSNHIKTLFKTFITITWNQYYELYNVLDAT